jgi:polar amino acid transport system substrate-binding protein
MKKFLMTMFALVLALSCVLMTACSGKSIKIGVQSGTTAEFFVKGNQEMLYDGFSNAECMSYDSSGLAVSAMLNGQVNYVIVDNEPAKMLVAQNAGAIKMIDVPLTTEEYALGVDKNQAGLLESINTILAQMLNFE